MYRMDITQHAPSDVRLLAPFFLDDMWQENFAKQTLDNADVQHTIDPDDVSFIREDDKFIVEIDAVETQHNQAVAGSFPMLAIHTNVYESDTMTEAEAIGGMLLDSGMDVGEIDHIIGASNWRNTDTIAANYHKVEQ